jgi:hypothetical protein
MKIKQCASIVLFFLAIFNVSFGQVRSITSVSTYYQESTSGNYSYYANPVDMTGQYNFGTTSGTKDNDLTLLNFTANGKNYGTSSILPSTVTFRRVDNPNVVGNRDILFFQHNVSAYAGGIINSYPYFYNASYTNDMSTAFSGRVLNRGSDNLFGNANEGFGNYNNIERTDIVYSSPQPVYSGEGNGVVIFERGSPSNHGAIKVAVILSVDGAGNPTSYSPIVDVTNSSWGTSDPTPVYEWGVFMRDGATYDLTGTNTNIGPQSIGGVFIPYSAFGLSASPTAVVYGYSLIPADFTGSSSSEILDFSNPILYPLNTNASDNSTGGLDLITVTGTFSENALYPHNLSGYILQDANGLTDNLINGNPVNICDGQQLFVTLFDPVTGLAILNSAPVTSSGYWEFVGIPSNTIYNIVLSTQAVNSGEMNPGPQLPAAWVNTGEYIGSNVPISTTLQGDGFLQIRVELSDISNIYLGIERKSQADVKLYTLSTLPVAGSSLVLNGNGSLNSPAQLSGSDLEDGILGASTGLSITSIPNEGELWYNGSIINAPMTLANYDPNLLSAKFSVANSNGTVPFSFRYAFFDQANVLGTDNSYTIDYSSVLPITILEFSAIKTWIVSKTAVNVSWVLSDGANFKKVIVERSGDGHNFTEIGPFFNTSDANLIQKNSFKDISPFIGVNYYRLKLLDNSGNISFSEIILVKIDDAVDIKISPNPVVNNLYLNGVVKGDIIKIFTSNGELLRELVAENSNMVFDMSNFEANIYNVMVLSKSGKSKAVFKVLKK